MAIFMAAMDATYCGGADRRRREKFLSRPPAAVFTGGMKAVILAAGKGTRMKELTNELPKPMLPVQGKPILEHIFEGIIAAGVHDIFIVTG